MLIITNKIEDNFVDNAKGAFVDKIEDVSMLIIVNRLHLEGKEVEEVSIIIEILIKIISIVFFA